jgi:hypothetical protein
MFFHNKIQKCQSGGLPGKSWPEEEEGEVRAPAFEFREKTEKPG